MARLKVFCTTSGFHDSIVAAPSRPAALKAWGARTDLFSMGVAKQVTDPEIVKRAMARPGEVIRLDRSGPAREAPTARPSVKKRAAKPPSRAKVASAEHHLEQLQAKQSKEMEQIEREAVALERRRDQLDKRHIKARRAAEERVEAARDAYQTALARWGG